MEAGLATGLSLAVGIIATLLGIAHFWFLRLFDFRTAMPADGPPLRPVRLGPLGYQVRRSDTWGIAVVMNNATSFTILGIGLGHLWLWPRLEGEVLVAVTLWWAAFWALRAASQFALGRRPLDWLLASAFLLLAVLDVLLATGPGPA